VDIFTPARAGQLETVKELLFRGVSINEKNEKGHSTLMLAAYNGHFDLVQFLIAQGADVNSVDLDGNSILMGVAFKGHTSIFELLIEAGANLDYTNPKNQTALDLAVMFGRRNLIFRINQIQNSQRSAGRIEQVKTWVKQVL
jgi:ankyrin repeat protein